MLKKYYVSSLFVLTSFTFAPLFPSDMSYGECEAVCNNENEGCLIQGGLDFLYWKPTQDGLHWGTIFETSGGSPGPTSFTPLNVNYKWSGGFRLWAGLQPDCFDWSIDLGYTHFSTQIGNNQTFIITDIAEDLNVIPEYYPGIAIGGSFGATSDFSSWKLNLNQVDFLFSREWSLCKDVSFTPFLGLRWEMIHEKLNESFHYEFISEIEVVYGRFVQDFSAVGVVTGFQTNWNVGCGLSLYGGMDVALVYGRFKINQSLSDSSQRLSSQGNDNSTTLTEYTFWDDRLGVDAAIGLKWRDEITKWLGVDVRLGWEWHLYTNFNQWTTLDTFTPLFDIDSYHGDLHLRGWVLGADFTF